MFFFKDETEIRKLVSFYSIYNSLYLLILITILLLTNGIYSAGNYRFSLIIILIFVAELLKYILGVIYFKNREINLSKKYSEKSSCFDIFSVCKKTKIKDGFKGLFTSLLMTLLYFILAVLYGAEVFSKYEETLMYSCLLTILTVFPACISLGYSAVISFILGRKPINKLEELLHQNFYLTISGSWLGAFVMPLDWDCPWQVWPIPCSFGALLGYTASHFVMIAKTRNIIKKKSKRYPSL